MKSETVRFESPFSMFRQRVKIESMRKLNLSEDFISKCRVYENIWLFCKPSGVYGCIGEEDITPKEEIKDEKKKWYFSSIYNKEKPFYVLSNFDFLKLKPLLYLLISV